MEAENKKIEFNYFSGGYCPSYFFYDETLVIEPYSIEYKKQWASRMQFAPNYNQNDISLTLTRLPNNYKDCVDMLIEYLTKISSEISGKDCLVCDGDGLNITISDDNGIINELSFSPSIFPRVIIELKAIIAPYMKGGVVPIFLKRKYKID